MRGAQGGHHDQADPDRLVGREGAALLEEVGERMAGDVLHDDAGAALVLHDVVDDDHVGVDDARGAARLTAHALVTRAEPVGRQVRPLVQPLQGDPAPQYLVVGEPHRAHAALKAPEASAAPRSPFHQ